MLDIFVSPPPPNSLTTIPIVLLSRENPEKRPDTERVRADRHTSIKYFTK
jgi:hypothetical protein